MLLEMNLHKSISAEAFFVLSIRLFPDLLISVLLPRHKTYVDQYSDVSPSDFSQWMKSAISYIGNLYCE